MDAMHAVTLMHQGVCTISQVTQFFDYSWPCMQDWEASAGTWDGLGDNDGPVNISSSPDSPVGETHHHSSPLGHDTTPSSSEDRPEAMRDQPEGAASDDNFEVSDDADEQQVTIHGSM